MAEESSNRLSLQRRSTRLNFVPPETFHSVEDELLYYKQECLRLKAIVSLQKQKIKKLLAAKTT